MREPVAPLDPDRVRARLAEVRAEVGPGVEVLAAVKYLAPEQLPVLAAAGVEVVGENRAQALLAKQPLAPGLTWDFIGQLQSRKVRDLVGRVRWIHSVATDSALAQLARHAPDGGQEVLVEVNVAGEAGKGGVAPAELDAFLERAAGACRVVGLMTMPPAVADPEGNRRWFAALARLAADRGLPQLSMGTSQDYVVAAQEGATVVRLGSTLYR